MSPQTLLLAAAASFPVAAVGLAGASLAERLGADAAQRCRLWTAALAASAAAALYVVVVDATGLSSPLALFGRTGIAPVAAAIVPPPVAFEAAPMAAFAPAPASEPGFTIDWALALILLIAAGALGRLVLLTGRLAALHRWVAASRPLEDEALQRGIRRWGGEVRIGDNPTPILVGWRAPVILIPAALAARIDAQGLYLICRHEWAHLERGDHRRILAEEAVVSLFWFNPLMGLIRRRLADAREEACDAAVIRDEAAGTRRAYARTLVETLKESAPPAPLLAFTGGRRVAVKRRLRAILKGPGAITFAAGPIALGAMLATCLAAWFVPVALAAEPMQPPSRYAPAYKPYRVAQQRPPVLSYFVPVPPSRPGVTPPPLDLIEQSAAALPRPAPIDYARPPSAQTEGPIPFNCTLTPEGRAIRCVAGEPDRQPDRAARTIAEIEGRTWPVGLKEETYPEPRMSFTGTPGGLKATAFIGRRTTYEAGPMTVWQYADGRLDGRPRTRFEMIPAADQTAAQAAARGRQSEPELAALLKTLNRSREPVVLKDEGGRQIGAATWVSGKGLTYALTRPVPLRLNGRNAGVLESDADGALWFEGRRTVDRGTPVPVRDKDDILRLRADLKSIEQGDMALLPFVPIMDPPLPASGVSSINLRSLPIRCTVTPRGKATDCAWSRAEPDPDPEATRKAIAQIEARAWPVDPAKSPRPDGRRVDNSPGWAGFGAQRDGTVAEGRTLVALNGDRLPAPPRPAAGAASLVPASAQQPAGRAASPAAMNLQVTVELKDGRKAYRNTRLVRGEPAKHVDFPISGEELDLSYIATLGDDGVIQVVTQLSESGRPLTDPVLAIAPGRPGLITARNPGGPQFSVWLTAMPVGFRLE